MKYTTWEMVDKATILRVKIEQGIQECRPQYEELYKEIKHVESSLIEALYRINKEMFLFEDLITYAMEEQNYAKVGRLYYDLRMLTYKRTEAKNRIAELHDRFKEYKKY